MWFGIALFLLGSLAVFREIKLSSANRIVRARIRERVRALKELWGERFEFSVDEFHPFAADPFTRTVTFEFLQQRGALQLFPGEFHSVQKAAEANLANWLEADMNVRATTAEIEHLDSVSCDFRRGRSAARYEVLQFRLGGGHALSAKGWMFAVVGPYFDDSKPFDFPRTVFTRFRSVSNGEEAGDEAHWAHASIVDGR